MMQATLAPIVLPLLFLLLLLLLRGLMLALSAKVGPAVMALMVASVMHVAAVV